MNLRNMNSKTFEPYQTARPGDKILTPTRGLRLHVGVNGRSWVMRYRDPTVMAGLMKQATLGDLASMSYAAAVAAHESAKRVMVKGVDPFKDLKTQKKLEADERKRSQKETFKIHGLTVAEMAEQWLRGHADKKVRGWETRRMITQELQAQPEFSQLPAYNLRLAEVAAFLERIITRPAQVGTKASKSGAPSIARMIRQALGQAHEWHAARGTIDDQIPNQFQRALKGDPRIRQRSRDRALTTDEIAIFLRWLPGSGFSKNMRAMIELILRTGMRPGEVASIEWEHVNLKAGTYELPSSKTKTGKARQVQLAPQVVEIMKSLKKDGHRFVFQYIKSTGEIVDKNIRPHAITIGQRGKVLPKRLAHWTPHDLRRSSRTSLARLGCPSDVAELILGHELGGVEGIYNRHLYLGEQREWLVKLNDHYDDLMVNHHVE